MTRIAVVGAGLIGQKHIEVVRNLAQLDAIVDPNPDTKAFADSVGAGWFQDVEEYLATQRPDGAIIATPNQLHLPHAAAFIAAGVPILVEKPLAESASRAARLVELADSAGVPVLVGHHRRHSPLAKTAKSIIENGELGRLVTVNAQFWLLKPDEYFDVAWRRQDGAGPVFINLIHDIDLLRHFCGEIVSVQATESSAVRGFEVEDTCVAILEFESGALGTVSITDTAAAPWSWELTAGEDPAYPHTGAACYTIGGTKGSLSVPDLKFWRHPGAQSWKAQMEVETRTCAPKDPIEEQLLHFVDVIENGAEPLVPGVEGLRNLQVLDAIKNAALHGSTQIVGATSSWPNPASQISA